MPITKKITLKSFPTKIEDLKSLLIMMVEKSRVEEGCLQYDLYQETSDSSTFYLIERWEDEQTLAAHKLTPHFDVFKEQLPDVVESKESHSLEVLC